MKLYTHQTGDVKNVGLVLASFADDGPTLNEHWFSGSCLLGYVM